MIIQSSESTFVLPLGGTVDHRRGASEDRVAHPAAQRDADDRACCGFCWRGAPACDLPRLVRVERNVRSAGSPGAIGRPWAPSMPSERRRLPGECGDARRRGKGRGPVEMGDRHAERRSRDRASREALRRAGAPCPRGCAGAWSVAIASIVPSARPMRHRLDVGHRTQRRVDLVQRVVGGESLVGEAEVVRRRLGGDRQAVGFGPAHELDAAGRREVQQVDPGPGEAHQLDVAHGPSAPRPRDGQPGRPRRLQHSPSCITAPRVSGSSLAVLGERDVEPRGVLQRTAHQLRVLHAVAVVGEHPHAGAGQLAERGQLLAAPARR